jgi:hypothetical protein
MKSLSAPAVDRNSQRLLADPSRVITRLFVPGHEGFEHQESRAGVVLARILALDEAEVLSSLDDVITRFDRRHRDLACTFRSHALELADRLRTSDQLSEPRMLLLGATFTSEYAIEGAALCNPSIVAHPDQAGMAAGSRRFVMSVRGIGEGHRSSIGFRTGIVDATGLPVFDRPTALATVGDTEPALLDAAVFHTELARLEDDGEAADLVFGALGKRFTRADLDEQLRNLANCSFVPPPFSMTRTPGVLIWLIDPNASAFALAANGTFPLSRYGTVNSAICWRAAVTVMPPIAISHRPGVFRS